MWGDAIECSKRFQHYNFVNPSFTLLSRVLNLRISSKAQATEAALWFQILQTIAMCPKPKLICCPILSETPELVRNHSWRMFAWRVARSGWSEESGDLFKHCIAKSLADNLTDISNNLKHIVWSRESQDPPEPSTVEAFIADIMRLKCMASERPEPMLRSIRALTLTHFFMTIWDLNPFEDALKHFETALIKSQTTKLASRTKVRPIDKFRTWSQNFQFVQLLTVDKRQ